jgi:hypothetical protein
MKKRDSWIDVILIGRQLALSSAEMFQELIIMATVFWGISFTIKNPKAPHQAHFSPLFSFPKITWKI